MCRFRWAVALLSLAVSGFFISFLPQVTIDNSTEAFLLDDDPAVIVYDAFREEFSRDDRAIVAIRAPDLFDLAFLERLRALHRAIEQRVPYVEEVDSLVNARVLRGERSSLVAEELLENWPRTQAEAERARAIAEANPLYEYTLLSTDRTITAVSVKPFTYTQEGDGFDALAGFDSEGAAEAAAPEHLKAAEGTAFMEALLALVAEHEGQGFEVHVAGALPMTHRLDVGLKHDLGTFMPVAMALMALLLALLFRRVSGVLLPLTIVGLSLLTTLGAMVMLGIPGSTAVQILPVFLLAVGVCDAVHILTIVYRRRAEGAGKHESIAYALGHSGLAVLMTSLTTAAGMASFVTAEMAPVVHLGFLAPLGVLLALVYTLTLLPALLAIFPLAAVSERSLRADLRAPLERVLVRTGAFATRAPWRVLFPTALLSLIAILGVLQVRFSHNGLAWFDSEEEIVRDFRVVDGALGGAVSVEVVIDAREPGGLYEPELLRRMEGIMREAPAIPADPLFIQSTMSIVDIVKETHQALNEGRPEMRLIPDTREAVAQELLLFEGSGSDDTAEWVDGEYRRARIHMRTPFTDALLYPALQRDLTALVERKLDGMADFQITGLITLLAQIFDAVIRSMMRSYAFALLVITPLMMLLLGSLRRGLVSMVPNLLPVLATLGVTGWMGLPLDSTTILVGAMVIGLAVDDTIHFMHKFQRYFEESGDLEAAVAETLRTTGSALLFTTLVLAAGFATFTLGEMANTRAFGMLASTAAVVAFAADLLVAPALLSIVEGMRRRRAAA